MHLPTIRLLATAVFCLGLGAAPVLAQTPDAAQAQSASLTPVAMLTEGGVALGADSPLIWELFALDPNGRPHDRVANGGAGTALAAAPGDYLLLAGLDLAQEARAVTLLAGENEVAPFVFGAGLVDLTPELAAGGEVFNGAAVFVSSEKGASMSYIGPTRAYVPAGKVHVTVVFDAVRMQDTLQVGAGETVTRRFAADAGMAHVTVSTGALELPEGKVPRIDIFAAPATPEGALKMVVYDMLSARRFTLPPGDYIAQGLVEGASAKVPFTLKAGDVVPVTIALPVGQIVIAAPGANSLALMKATDNPAEPWRMIFSQWDLTQLAYLVPEGDYLVEAFFETGKVEKTAHVAAGTQVDVQLP
ncbi:MAG: hypothetical protein K0B00_13935 [Rhodobacteraceae bacterium]|nr:hypothetical protein [Paracoccaceae bacterium]